MNDTGCYLCRSNNYRLIATKSKYSIVKCDNCDFVFTTPIPSQEEIATYYSKFDYKDSLSAEKVIRLDARRSLEKISKFAKMKGELLDVGCGRGYLLDEARKLGWKTHGVDASKLVTDYATNTLRLNVFCRDIFLFRPEHTYDLVILNQVIEHFINPEELINHCGKYLVKGGLLYIATPNVESVSARVLKDNFDHYIPPEHLSYFSQHTIKRSLEKLGFKILYIGSWSYPSDLGGIIKTLLGKKIQSKRNSELLGKNQEIVPYRSRYFNIKQVKSFLFDRIFCHLFSKLLSFDSWGINLEILAIRL
ncbi:MAG: class I SAM-dependent methyltransferase [Candidatus Gottesmanbacteria bacterium]|nr:class I SAM-dependent methyltransferase [Candidatus Gottesmanbacteria bacterium]